MKSIVLGFSIVFVSTISHAAGDGKGYTMCIHSHYTSGIGVENTAQSGHASVSIEKHGQRVKSWGYFPAPPHLTVDYKFDGTLTSEEVAAREKDYSNYPGATNPKIHQAKFCKSINEADIERARSLADAYANRFGEWTELANNCVVFAKYMYTNVTKDKFALLLPQPHFLHHYITKANEQNVTNIADANLNKSGETEVEYASLKAPEVLH